MSEGYIKFIVHLTKDVLPNNAALSHLNEVRTELHDLGLIGVLPNGIGYGNVSVRMDGSDKFVISGTATGGKSVLSPEDYCLIDRFDVDRNEVFCTGQINASSESMSHGSVYRANSAIRCVIHVHHHDLFYFMLAGKYLRTAAQAAYGTPEIAHETERLVRESGTSQGIFVMAGHEDGIIAYGANVQQASQLLLEIYQKSGVGKHD